MNYNVINLYRSTCYTIGTNTAVRGGRPVGSADAARRSGRDMVAIFYPFSLFYEVVISLLSLRKQPNTAPNLLQRGVEYGTREGHMGSALMIRMIILITISIIIIISSSSISRICYTNTSLSLSLYIYIYIYSIFDDIFGKGRMGSALTGPLRISCFV